MSGTRSITGFRVAGYLLILVLGVGLGYGGRIATENEQSASPGTGPSPSSSVAAVELQNLESFGMGMPGVVRKNMTRDEFHAHVKWLHEYYKGDPFALATIAASTASTERNRYKNDLACRDALEAGLAQLEVCELKLQLLELEMFRDLGATCYHIESADEERWLPPLKEGMRRWTKRAWPASLEDPDEWRSKYNSTYREICWQVAQCAKPEEVTDLLVHTPVYLYIAKTWPYASRGMLPSYGSSENMSNTTVMWLKAIIGDGNPPEEERRVLEQAIELVNRWYEKETKGARRALFRRLEKEHGAEYKLPEG